MTGGKIWWNQIGSSIRLIDSITDLLHEERSFVLHVPRSIPWKQEFYEAIELRRASFGGGRRLRRLPWTKGAEPGEFIMEHLYQSDEHYYWPGMSHAEFFAGLPELLLHRYYVWITGIETEKDMSRWISYISAYRQKAKALPFQTVFILEYIQAPAEVSGIDNLRCTVAAHDCRVFALEAAAAFKSTDCLSYRAELAQSMSDGNPELCCALLQADGLLADPVQTAVQVIAAARDSSGHPFLPMTAAQLTTAAWEAMIGLLFPILERRRLRFIEANSAELYALLPIRDQNGTEITNPNDLELGPLAFLVSGYRSRFPAEGIEQILLCRNARNLLAHNQLVPFKDVQKILAA